MAGTEKGSKRFFMTAAAAGGSSGTTSLFQMSFVCSLPGVRILRISAGKPSQGSMQPGMATSAAIRSSKAAARGARSPAMLRPVRAILRGSTSGRADNQSTRGLTTFSQVGVNTTRSTKSNCPWPGPS